MTVSRPGIEKERQLERACMHHTMKAVDVLVNTMNDEGADVRWRIVAAKEILDRAWGRAKQSVTANVTVEGSEALIDAINRGRSRIEEV